MAVQITVKDLSAGIREALFQDLSFTLSEGDRMGVVGNNGAGKTTLLKCVEGSLAPWSGNVTLPRGKRLLVVPQTVPSELESLSLRDAVLDAIDPESRDYLAWRVDVVLDKFGAPDEMLDRPLAHLSGGWQRLALIARAWVADPDILLIDEPTNHLDLAKILMLERWLQRELQTTPLLIVSHDRRFLQTCTNRTLFLRPSLSRVYDYSFARARALLEEDDRVLELKKDRELDELRRLRKSAHTLRQIGVDNYSAAALRKSNQIARRADAIQDSLPSTHVEPKRDIKLISQSTRANRLINIEGMTITQPSGAILFRIGKLDIGPGERVVVLGRNGTGKTQFIQKLRAGFQLPDKAREEGLSIGPSLLLGYIDQNMSQLPADKTLHDFISAAHGTDFQRATSLLVSAGFPLSQQNSSIGSLSPGERARLSLLYLRLSVPSFYLMDEPTNHLDVAGQEQLESEILTHGAAAILVSHDRAFIENVGTRYLVIADQQLLEVESPDIFYQSLSDDIPLSQLVSRVTIL
jgi:ATPase subunit of ABC transporter with duplicated ATPase domains